MKNKNKFIIIFSLLFFLSCTKVYASNELKCTYSRSAQSPFTIKIGEQQSIVGSGISNSTIDYDAKTDSAKGNYDVEITMDLTTNARSVNGKLFNNSDTKDVKIETPSETYIYVEMMITYTCPEFVLVAKNKDQVFASNNSALLYQLQQFDSNNYYIMKNTKQERNNKDICFYHQEGLMTYMDELEGGSTDYKRVSLYVDLQKDEMYYIDNNIHYRSEKINKDLKECPIAYSFEVSPRKFKEITDKDADLSKSYYASLYELDANGNLVSKNIEKIKEQLKRYVDSFNNISGNVNDKCKAGALTKAEFDMCYKMVENKYNTNDTAIQELERLINFALISGLTEQSQEIIDARNALNNYKNVNNSSTQNDLKNRIIHSSYCKYKSNADNTHIVLSKKASDTINWNDGNTSYDITTWTNSNPYKYYIDIYSDGLYNNKIGQFHENSIKEQIEGICFGLNYDIMLNAETAKTLNCFEYINYDVDDNGKVTFISSNMLTNKDNWDKKFELIEVGYDNPTDNNKYTKVDNTKSYAIPSEGFIFGKDADCSSYGGLIYNNEPLNCSDFFDDETKSFIGTLYFYIEIIAIIVTIGLTIMDYSSAILNSDQDKMKKNSSKLLTRGILIVIILLLPVLVRTIIGIFNIKGFNGNEDPLCGIISNARKNK